MDKTPEELPSPNPDVLGSGYYANIEGLLTLRNQFGEELNETGVHLIDNCIKASYVECIDTKYEQKAKTLLQEKLPELDLSQSPEGATLSVELETADPENYSNLFIDGATKLALVLNQQHEDISPEGVKLFKRSIVSMYKDLEGKYQQRARENVEQWLPNFFEENKDLMEINPEQ